MANSHDKQQKQDKHNNQNHDKTFTVSVDGEPIVVPRTGNTPRKILELAGLDPSTRYLIEKRGNKTISYKDNADDEIQVHQHQIFVTGRCGAVPVA